MLVLQYIFLDMPLWAWETKAKINKWHYIKLKAFCTVEEISNKTKRQSTEWQKIFAKDISDEVNIQNIERTHATPDHNTNNLIKKLAEDLNRYFFKEDT